jgi:hypothetical protein
MPTPVIRLLLGPQRPVRNLRQAVESLPLRDGAIASISAGWQEAEGDIDEIQELIGRPLRDLNLYARAEDIFDAHPDLHDAYRNRQNQLKEQQRLYRLRLRHLMNAARQVLRSEGDPVLLAAEQRHAIAQLRALDRHHEIRVQSIHGDFHGRFGAGHYAPISKHFDAIREVLDDSQALLITGGNIIVLLNRLLLFGVAQLLQQRHIIAWSAGAMTLCERIVLFHDRTPEGRRDPELLGAGLGILPGRIILPDARRRIRTKDPVRVGLFCRRFAPSTCTLLDNESLLRIDDNVVTSAERVSRLKSNGGIGIVGAA